MRGLRRTSGLLIPMLLIALGLLWPAIFTGTSQSGPVSDPVTFSNLTADFTVDPDGLMHATETITAVLAKADQAGVLGE